MVTNKRHAKKQSGAHTAPQRQPVKAHHYEEILEDVAGALAPKRMPHVSTRAFAIILIVTGLIGLTASFVLTADKIHVLRDPNYNPICNINPIFSCGSVMKSSQAQVLGIPNTVFGLVGFSMVLATAATLLAGARMKAWFWRCWMVGMTAGLGGFLYLFTQSVFNLKTLCVYCMSTWAALLPLIWYSFIWSLQNGYLPVPKRAEGAAHFIRKEHVSLLLLAYIVIIVIIVTKFWYFFQTL